MEFVDYGEAMALLKEQGIREVKESGERVCLELTGDKDVVHLHLTTPGCQCEARDGAAVVPVEEDKLADAVEEILGRLHSAQLLLLPVAKWRNVFDAVAFSMADNEDWQAVDTAATVELNTRDPLLCEPGDLHTVRALIRALFSDADRQDQGLVITTTTAPITVELVPGGAVRVSFGNPVLADEVAEAFRT